MVFPSIEFDYHSFLQWAYGIKKVSSLIITKLKHRLLVNEQRQFIFVKRKII